MMEKEIVKRLELIQKTMPENAWYELLDNKAPFEASAGKFATLLDIVEDMIFFLITDIKEEIRRDEELRAKWQSEREAREAKKAEQEQDDEQ